MAVIDFEDTWSFIFHGGLECHIKEQGHVSFITSCVSGRGHRIGAVCLCVCQHSHSQTVLPLTLIFGIGLDPDLR